MKHPPYRERYRHKNSFVKTLAYTEREREREKQEFHKLNTQREKHSLEVKNRSYIEGEKNTKFREYIPTINRDRALKISYPKHLPYRERTHALKK